MASLRQKNGTWYVRYYDENGLQREKSLRTKKRREAMAKMAELVHETENRGVRSTQVMARLTLADAYARVVDDYEVRGLKSAATVHQKYAHLKRFFSPRRELASIDTTAVTTYRQRRMTQGVKPATINRELCLLKRMFNICEMAYRPTIKMGPETVRDGYFNPKQLRRLIAALPDDVRPAIRFAALTGWRRGEFLPLRWSQVDRDQQVITLAAGTTKNNEPRTLPYGMLPDLVEIIDGQWAEHQRLSEQGRICPFVWNRNGKEIRDFRVPWQRACEAAGRPDGIVHDLRRTAIRELHARGIPEQVAMMISGHKTAGVYRRYNISDTDQIARALAKLAEPVEHPDTGNVVAMR